MSNPTVVFTKPREVVVQDGDKPAPERGQLLVQSTRTLISTGTELTILSGEFPKDSAWSDYGRYPFRAGYSNVGKVVAVGPGVDDTWVGRRVASGAPHALHNVMNVEHVFPIEHDNVPDEEASFHTIAAICANGVRRPGVGWGDSVVVYGAGILGQLAARFCRLSGARPVIVVDIADPRLQLLPDDPAVIPLNPKREQVKPAVEKATRGRLADFVFEVTGNQNLIVEEFQCLREQGRFVLLSSPRGPIPFDFHDLCNAPSFSIIGTHVRSHARTGELDLPWTIRRHVQLFLDLIADGEIAVAPLITHRGPYTEAPRLYHMLLEDRSSAMGVVLEWPD